MRQYATTLILQDGFAFDQPRDAEGFEEESLEPEDGIERNEWRIVWHKKEDDGNKYECGEHSVAADRIDSVAHEFLRRGRHIGIRFSEEYEREVDERREKDNGKGEM